MTVLGGWFAVLADRWLANFQPRRGMGRLLA
jgi:hypothetical protein